MSDTKLLDALEHDIRKNGPMLLWSGRGDFPGGPRGLALARLGLWDLRAALRESLGLPEPKEKV